MSDERFILGLRELNLSEQILLLSSTLIEGINFREKDVKMSKTNISETAGNYQKGY